MPTRCNRWFLLQILLLAQYVSGTTMPIIRSSRVLYKWLLPVVFGPLVFKLLVWCGAEGCVSGCCCPQTGHITLSSTPYRQLENQAPNTTGSNHLYNTLELLMMGIMVPETCWACNNICNKNSSVASSRQFISTYYRRCTVKITSNIKISYIELQHIIDMLIKIKHFQRTFQWNIKRKWHVF